MLHSLYPGLCREDLRHLAICSVDPPGCKDIDDALHIRPLPNGHSEVGVHIADVTSFLLPGTAMDDEAASRSASQPCRPAAPFLHSGNGTSLNAAHRCALCTVGGRTLVCLHRC